MKRSIIVGPAVLGMALLPVAHHMRWERIKAQSAIYDDCQPTLTVLDIQRVHVDADRAHDILVPVEIHQCGGVSVQLRTKVD